MGHGASALWPFVFLDSIKRPEMERASPRNYPQRKNGALTLIELKPYKIRGFVNFGVCAPPPTFPWITFSEQFAQPASVPLPAEARTQSEQFGQYRWLTKRIQ
jgi:hypothetical protein